MTTLLEIVSPERLLLSRPVDMVTMPGLEGDLAALGGHAPMIVVLRGGVVTLTEGGRATDRLYVAGGFAEITADRCTVLADEAIPVNEIDRAEAQRRLDAAQAQYEAADKLDITEIDAAMDRIQAARAMVDAAAG